MTQAPDPCAVALWDAYDRLTQDPRYVAGLDWGQARPGHPEGSVLAHIAELVENVRTLRREGLIRDPLLFARLYVAIHVHDTFKAESHARRPGVQAPAISDPDSHASIARAFLAEYSDDAVVHAIVQWHDEPYAIWRKLSHGGDLNVARWRALVAQIPDWSTFLAFCLIDGVSGDKRTDPVDWLLVYAHTENVIPEGEYEWLLEVSNALVIARTDRQLQRSV